MKWRMLLAVIFGSSVSAPATFSQRPPAAERLSLERSASQPDAFFSSIGMVQFQLIQGRLRLNPPLHRKGAQQRSDPNGFERILVTATRGIPSLHYVSQRSIASPPSRQHLMLSVQDACQVKIDSAWLHRGERSVLYQPEFGSIRWEITRQGRRETCVGATLFHVRLHDPHRFDQHFGDLIFRLLRGVSLAQLSDEIIAAVLSDRIELPQMGADEVAQCVDALRAPQQGDRMSAQRQLLIWGTPVIAMLQQVSPDDLDLEQQTRVTETIRMLRPRVDDTPRSLAMLVVNDRQFWSLAKPWLSETQWTAVRAHLRRVGLPIRARPEQTADCVAVQSP
ncbi:MAG: hypothetical protein ACF788_05130 [Novipirellula sp. JB048]